MPVAGFAQFNQVPVISTSLGGVVSGTYGYFTYISGTTINGTFLGDGSGLTGISGSGGNGDRITSGTTSMVANSATSIISITNAGVTGGYFNANGVLTVPGISATANLTSVTTLYASGKVGIGTSTPGAALDVSGSIKTNGVLYGSGATSTYGALTIDGTKNSWGGINFKSAGTNLKTFMVNGTYSGVYNTADNAWDWLWNGSTLSTGTVPAANIGAGTVSGALYRTYGFNGPEYDGNNNAYYVDPNGTTNFNTFYAVSYCGGGYGCVSGGMLVSAVQSYSDRRLKQNIKPLDDHDSTLAKIMKLQPVSYDWRDRTMAKTEGHQYGFIAQDVEKVFPDLVKNRTRSTTITLENGRKEPVEKLKSLDYTHMIAPLVKAVQELKVLFDSDHAALEALKADNDNLRAETRNLRSEFEAYKSAHP